MSAYIDHLAGLDVTTFKLNGETLLACTKHPSKKEHFLIYATYLPTYR